MSTSTSEDLAPQSYLSITGASSSGVRSYTDIQSWISTFSALGVTYVDHVGIRQLALAEDAEGVVRRFREGRGAGWLGILEDDVAATAAAPAGSAGSSNIDSMLSVLVASLARFEELDANCLPEEEWRSTFVTMIKGICNRSGESISAGSAQTHRALLQMIGHPELRKVKPDLTLGLVRKSILIARDAGVDAPKVEMAVDAYVLSRDPAIPYELSMRPLSLNYFPWFFAELKSASGSAGEARVQVTTACYISLQMLKVLSDQARAADPEYWMRPPSNGVMGRAYGLQTEGGGKGWRISVMSGSEDWSRWGEPNSFRMGSLWRGDVTCPSDLIDLCAVLRAIEAQNIVRMQVIGNWLWCLRHSRVKRQTKATKRREGGDRRGQPKRGGARRNAQGRENQHSTVGDQVDHGQSGAGIGDGPTGRTGTHSAAHSTPPTSAATAASATATAAAARMTAGQVLAMLRGHGTKSKSSALSRKGIDRDARVRHWVEQVSMTSGSASTLSTSDRSGTSENDNHDDGDDECLCMYV